MKILAVVHCKVYSQYKSSKTEEAAECACNGANNDLLIIWKWRFSTERNVAALTVQSEGLHELIKANTPAKSNCKSSH
jgi:hypothetical protein